MGILHLVEVTFLDGPEDQVEAAADPASMSQIWDAVQDILRLMTLKPCP